MLIVLRMASWKHIKAISYKARRTHTSVFAVKSQEDSPKMLELRPSMAMSQEKQQSVRGLGYNMTYCWSSDTNILVVTFDEKTMVPTVQFVHQHISSLFGSHLQHGCTLLSYDLMFLPAILPITSNVLISHLVMVPTLLDAFISKMENQEYLTMKNQMRDLPLFNVKFISCKHLSFINAYTLAPEILSRFEGQTVVMYNAIMEDATIVKFVANWQKGNFAPNLKFLKLYLNFSHLFHPAVITNSLKIKIFFHSKRPPCFQYPVKNYFGAEETLLKHDLVVTTYVVRETDKVVASISVSEDRFDFCVWEWNETQMKEMGYIE
ncbi:hypothetical protein GCK72_023018 [Caenorhabditis remanei]|uniref:F-box associated domain-containing protein n=1 Tax=Caenorhabditis remanei TaxID=31234 RepID=A0A6A5FVV7_CAERE|nr:hypothetical protein GCK72_023018 [Caenorhabditis remanei]KAF1746561.1 hypothetical protein GCK72_023018 [Caenorhabditis remanei]